MWIFGSLQNLGYDFCDFIDEDGYIKKYKIPNKEILKTLNRNIFFNYPTEYYIVDNAILAVKMINPNV